MNERDEFDRIIQGLEFDLSDLDLGASNNQLKSDESGQLDAGQHESGMIELEPDEHHESALSEPDLDEGFDRRPDEQFYRDVPPASLRPAKGTGWAWAGVTGAPLIVLLTAIARIPLPSSAMIALTLVSVASVIFLISRLPERGPSQRDYPDDGAVL